MSRVGDRDRALAEMVIDSLDDDGYFKASFEELAALLPEEHGVLPEEFAAALKLVQSLDPAGHRRAHARGMPAHPARMRCPADTRARDVAIAITNGHLTAARQPRMGAAAARGRLQRGHAARSRAR